MRKLLSALAWISTGAVVGSVTPGSYYAGGALLLVSVLALTVFDLREKSDLWPRL